MPNCVSKPSAVWPNGVAMTPALAMTASNGSPLGQQPVGADTYAFQVAKIEFDQFEAFAIGLGCLSHLLGCGFSLVQITRRAYNVSTMGGQGPRGFNAEAG